MIVSFIYLMFNSLFSKSEISFSSNESSSHWAKKKEAIQLKSELDSQFVSQMQKIQKNKAKEATKESLVVGLKEELNQLKRLNDLKQKKIQKILNQTSKARERSPANYESNGKTTNDLIIALQEIEEKIADEEENKKKNNFAKEKVENKRNSVMKCIEAKSLVLGKVKNQCERLKNECLHLKNNQYLTVINKNEFISATVAYKSDFEGKTSLLREKLEAIKAASSKVIDKMAKKNILNKAVLEKKQELASKIQTHIKISVQTLSEHNLQDKILEFSTNFDKIFKIMDLTFKTTSDIAAPIVHWLKKSEFTQMSLAMHYQENIKSLTSKTHEMKTLITQKQTLAECLEKNTESKLEKNQQKGNEKQIFQKEAAAVFSEKMVFNIFSKFLMLIRSFYMSAKYIENCSNYKDPRFNKLNFAIEEILNRFELSKVTKSEFKDADTKRSSVDPFVLNVMVNLKNCEILKLLKSLQLKEIILSLSSKHSQIHPSAFLEKSYKFIKKNLKKLLKVAEDFLNLITTATKDLSSTINSISANLSKSPQKYLSRLRTLYESKSRVSFLVSSESSVPYARSEVSSLEQLLSNRNPPEIRLKKHKRLRSESNLLMAKRKNVYENTEIENKIHELVTKSKNIKKQTVRSNEFVKFPQKYLVKPDFIRRLYVPGQSSRSLQSSPNLKH